MYIYVYILTDQAVKRHIPHTQYVSQFESKKDRERKENICGNILKTTFLRISTTCNKRDEARVHVREVCMFSALVYEYTKYSPIK